MENQPVEIKRMRPSETIRVVMISRGALGIQLLWRMDMDSVVEVKRVEPNIDKSTAILPGDPIDAVFEVKSIHKGTVKITFYETQSWNKEFKDIIQKELIVEVND